MHGSKIGKLLLPLIIIFSLVSCGGGSNNSEALPSLSLIDPPKEITATPTNGVVTINWVTAGESVKSYQLYYKEDINNVAGEYQSLNLTNQTDLTYIHTVTNGNQYTYRVSAINEDDQEGTQSKESNTVTPIGAPEQPIFITATAADASITLEWNTNTAYIYNLTYQEAGGAITIIEKVTSPFKHINSAAKPSTITNGLEYTYTIIAINALNKETASQPVKLTPLKLPLKATGLTATSGDFKVTLNWTRNPIQLVTNDQYGELKYNIYREEKDSGGTPINITSLTPQPINLTVFTDDAGLTPGMTYYYAISQVNQNNNEGAKSVYVSAVPTEKLAAAKNLTLTVAPNILKFSWSMVAGADEYELLENKGAGFNPLTTRIISSPVNGTISVNLDLSVHQHTFGTLYLVRACRANVCGPDSLKQVSTSVNDILPSIGYFKASNNESSIISDPFQFGYDVDINSAGNTMVIGALGESSGGNDINKLPTGSLLNSGAAYVFVKETDRTKVTYGTWSQQAFIKASNSDAGDQFGRAVSISDDGNTIAVGSNDDSLKTGVTLGRAFKDDNDTTGQAGAVLIFTRSGVEWTQQAYIKASNTRAVNLFGFDVALSGDGQTLAVGSRNEDSVSKGLVFGANPPVFADSTKYGGGYGAVYVFKRTVTTWEQQVFIKAFNASKYDYFGWSVGLNQDGAILVVGADGESSNGSGVDTTFTATSNPTATISRSGAVYTFKLNTGVWAKEAFIKSSKPTSGANFGWSSALNDSGTVLVVGALYDSNTASRSGSADVYTRATKQDVWVSNTFLKANTITAGDRFGTDVAVSGDGNVIAVGAPYEDTGVSGIVMTNDTAAPDSGAVYIFRKNGTTYSPENFFLKAPNNENLNANGNRYPLYFGDSISLNHDGSKLVVGAHGEGAATSGTNNPPAGVSINSGAVYLY